MASIGPGRYVAVVLHVGGSKLADIKLVLQREPRSGKAWFPYGSISPNEEHVDAIVRELHEKTGLILTLDDLTLLSDAPVRVALHVGHQFVYVYLVSVPIPYMTTQMRTHAQLEHVVTAQSTINPVGSYVVPETIDIGGLSLTPAKNGLLPSLKQKNESLLHFGYVTQWEIFRRAIYTHQVLYYDDPSVPRQFFMFPWLSSVDSGHVWLLIRGYINQLCWQTPTDLRMGAPIPTTTFASLPVPLTDIRCKAAINSP
jgi:ADP-ribose pyrophosphatase YjhB (NUDIX family)